MSGGVPDEEQLRRIEQGVRRRIARRRETAQRVGGAAAAVGALAIVVGGFSLVLPRSASLSSGASGGGSAADSSALVKVLCHGDRATLAAEADPKGLPESAFEACARALEKTVSDAAAPEATGVQGQAAGAPSPSALPGVLCRSDDGLLQVYPDGTACSSVGMTRVDG
ncbi:hypothetical protein [uncultured Amnibacterium sp.]|uniref:hypothetical protein n=1 Tax=uncultured Amnibacterium sp. TaxID=1631851 RepID=UPI0035CA93ED